jgi:hypothetical protein
MSRTAQQVIAEEIFNDSDKWDLDDQGMEAAALIIARLERYGFRIIRHRVVSDEDAAVR